MNLAYGWAFFNPVRKVYYNLAITGLSVGICFLVGGIETLGLISTEVKGLSRAGGFWGFMRDFNINVAGFAIVGLFIVTWAGRLADLAIRPHRGEVERALARRPRTREGQRAALTQLR